MVICNFFFSCNDFKSSNGFFPRVIKSWHHNYGKGFSAVVKNFLPFSSNLKLSSANSFSLEVRKFAVWERVNSFPNKPWFLRVCRTSPLKTMWKKEKLLVTSNFSFSHSVFYPFGKLSVLFTKFEIVVCKLSQVGRV